MPDQGWLVLPDTPRPRSWWPRAAQVMPGSRVVPHASGRPWLIGSWNTDEIRLARAGRSVVAVIGAASVTGPLVALAARITRVDQLDAAAEAVLGCAHVVASVDGVVRVQGSLSGLRQVFYAGHDGMVAAADRADVLARLTGAGVDEEMLAAQVACGGFLAPPLAHRPLWRGIHAVPPDHYLRLGVGGTLRLTRRWTPPSPRTSLAKGAGRLRQELANAVTARRPASGRWGSDLSGGMDSTSLCLLAARAPDAGGSGLVTFRCAEAEAANDDAVFATRAAAALPRADHLVLAQADMPSLFANPGRAGGVEAPYRFARTLARTDHIARVLAERGVRVHLAGHGGDEVLHDGAAYLRDLLRTRPLLAVARVRAHRALSHWSWRDTLAAMADGRGLDAWWLEQADRLTESQPLRRTPTQLWWGWPLRAPAWMTPAAVDTTRDVLRRAAEHAEPLAPQRGQHATLATITAGGPAYRQLADVFAANGVRLEMPYLDDRVIEAALAVRQHERRTPWRYRPLLAEAMRGILPAAVSERSTKGEFGQDVRDGLDRNVGTVLEVFADSALAAAGLIDTDRLRAALLAPRIDNSVVFAVENLLGCETWLRTTTGAPVGPSVRATEENVV